MFRRCGSGSQTAPICSQPGHQAVEDAARDDDVGAGVVVRQREAGAGVVQRRGNTGERRADGDRGDDPALPSIDVRVVESERIRGRHSGVADGSSLHFQQWPD